MKKKLNILMAASECIPFAKTGGLADVVGSLPIALKKMGHDVRIVMPKYSFIDCKNYNIVPDIELMGVWMGNKLEWCAVHKTIINDDIPVYFIEFNLYFERSGLYHDEEFNDYLDNPKRFAFLSRAALQLCHEISFKPDIVHANDWQTALIAAYIKIWHWNDPLLGSAASVLTIHNMAYQGIYPKIHYDYLGLREENYTQEKFECFGAINFLKGGIYYADMINTVSPAYARETKTPEGGIGLAPYLNNRGDDYIGILNGVDYLKWDPEIDPYIPKNYSINDLDGKKACKNELQKRLGLEVNEIIPVFGIVSRLVFQKGLHLLADCIEQIVNNMLVQFVILGAGDKNLENFFKEISRVYPERIGTSIGYNNELAHLIEAGSDFFLMPSIYEPCGLNQIYSLKYGTLPIVRATGGLDDTVEDYNENTGSGNGFKFYEASARAVYYSIGWAASTYYDRKSHMKKMIKNAMGRHFSWNDSAEAYVELYRKAIANKLAYDNRFT